MFWENVWTKVPKVKETCAVYNHMCNCRVKRIWEHYVLFYLSQCILLVFHLFKYFNLFPAPDKRNIFGNPLKERDSDYPREEEGVNYFGDNNIVINATNQHICYNQTVYDDMLVEPTEYFGLTLSVESNNARTPQGYNTAAVRIVDDDGKLQLYTQENACMDTENSGIETSVFTPHYIPCSSVLTP